MAFLAAGIQRQSPDIRLELHATIRAFLEFIGFLPGLGNNVLWNQVKFVRQTLYEARSARSAGIAAFNFPGRLRGKLVTCTAIHTYAPTRP